MSVRIAIFTVGCRANQADSDRLARAIDPRCVEIVDGGSAFDIAVINTCCVTAEAERDCRKLARRVKRISPAARVVLTGCAISAIADFGDDLGVDVETRGGGDVDLVELAHWINRIAGSPDASESTIAEPAPPTAGRVRPLVKVQTGCSHGCTYCIVPVARGPERSTPLVEVLERVEQLAEQGFSEVVLTGVQLGAWGRDLPAELRLADLVREVAERFAPGRVRLSSIEPWSVDEALLEVVAGSDRVCSHLHVPLQSGDDRVLEQMGRGYQALLFADIARQARRIDPDLALGTDVICGFPGEDRTAFENTLAVLRDVRPAYLHVFPFSPRASTLAAEMCERVDVNEVKRRVAEAIAAGQESTRDYRRSLAGRVREVIVEGLAGRSAKALTDTFVPVALEGGTFKVGGLVHARLEDGVALDRVAAFPVIH